jgi:hypothetical protein
VVRCVTLAAVSKEVYFSVDVEADGPIPGPYSMVSFGVAVAGRRDGGFVPADPAAETFYRELKPISDEYVAAALEVSGLDRGDLMASGAEPAVAMTELVEWIAAACGPGARPVMVAYPAPYDWMFLYWYLMRFAGASPFGHSGCLDLKTMYAVRAGVPLRMAVKRLMPPELHSRRRHTHNALDDALEQADLFINLMRWSGPQAPGPA